MQSFRLEFSTHGGCYDFLVRDKDRCEKFLGLFVGKLSSFSFFSVIFFLFLSPLFTIVRLIELDTPSLHSRVFRLVLVYFDPYRYRPKSAE